MNLTEKDPYQYRRLKDTDLNQMHRSFIESFADYAVPYSLSQEEFIRKMKHKVHVSFDHSYGSFSNQKLVAFIFHSLGPYEGSLMAYNGGTGVVPGHRGERLPLKMYEQVLPILKQDGIERSVLEALVKNGRAISIYENVGFQRTKEFICFKLHNSDKLRGSAFHVVSNETADLDQYNDIGQCKTSFGDTLSQLRHNIEFETTLEVKVDERLAGYIIFQHELGRVTRFGVRESFRGRGIGRALFHGAQKRSKKPLTVINVNQDYTGEIEFLRKVGFVNTLNQYELQLML